MGLSDVQHNIVCIFFSSFVSLSLSLCIFLSFLAFVSERRRSPEHNVIGLFLLNRNSNVSILRSTKLYDRSMKIIHVSCVNRYIEICMITMCSQFERPVLPICKLPLFRVYLVIFSKGTGARSIVETNSRLTNAAFILVTRSRFLR